MKASRYATFYFVDAGIKVVSLGTWTDKLGVQRQTQFNVQRPTYIVIAETGDETIIYNPGGVRFGTLTVPTLHVGIEFTATRTFGPAGEESWTNMVRSFQNSGIDTTGRPWVFSVGYSLDNVPIYDTGNETNDSPLVPYRFLHWGEEVDLDYLTIDEDFEMYFMWRSPTANSIRVPIKKVMWDWAFSGHDPIGGPGVNRVNMIEDSSSHSIDPTAIDTSTHPEWEETFGNGPGGWEADD